MSKQATTATSQKLRSYPPLAIAPARVLRGENCLANSGQEIASLGVRPLVVGGNQTSKIIKSVLALLKKHSLASQTSNYSPDCAESSLARLKQSVQQHQADLVIGVGGGKALDMAKLLAHQCNLPIVTIPTSGATCAAWTALSNVYSEGWSISIRCNPKSLSRSVAPGL